MAILVDATQWSGGRIPKARIAVREHLGGLGYEGAKRVRLETRTLARKRCNIDRTRRHHNWRSLRPLRLAERFAAHARVCGIENLQAFDIRAAADGDRIIEVLNLIVLIAEWRLREGKISSKINGLGDMI